MKKIIAAALMMPLMAFAQTYPSPTFQNLTVNGTFTGNGAIGLSSLTAQAANTVLANVTGSSASPTAIAIPSCSTSTSALQYTTSMGWNCYTSSATTTGTLAQFATTTSAQLASVISDETGTGSAVFGTSPTIGTATLNSPSVSGGTINNASVGASTPSTGAFTSLSSTSAPTIGSAAIYPTVPTNAALTALATTTISKVVRQGYTVAGDTTPMLYQASASACSLNSGNGDNGSQVKSADSKCWIAVFPAGPVDASEFGLDLTGATDNTTNLQNAWNYAASVGANLQLPATPNNGYIKFSSITMPAPTGYFSGASALVGQLGNTTLKSTVTGTTCAINVAATIGQPNFGGTGWGGWALWSINNAGFGLCLNAVSHFTSQSFSIINFTFQIYALDTFTITLNRPILENGQHGIYANYNALSYPNDWNINQGYVSGQTQDGLLIYSPADFNIRGGDYESINVANTAGYCTINVQGNPVNGTKGLSIFGGYFQDNGGNGDVCFTQNASGNGSGPGVHSITGVEFGRISSSTYVTHEIVLSNGNSAAQTVVSMHGNSFNNFNSYVTSSARAFWVVSSPSTANYKLVGWGDNRFGNATEAPGDCLAASVANCINLPDGHIEQWGVATSAATGTGFPVSVTWPLACPTAVDSVVVSPYNNTTPFATGVASYTATSGTLVASTASSLIQWRALCH